MKINIKMRVMILLIAISIGFSTSISYGTKMTNNPQIKLRGLVFDIGTSSDQVRLLKDFFRERGEDRVPWGYNYDNRTKELVRNYQSLNGLKADGIAGKATIDRINREISEEAYNLGLRIPTIDHRGELILINKSSNTLYFLRDGEIQDSYPVATGKTVYLTPSGKFRIVVKFKNPGWGGAGVSDPIPGGAPNNPLGKRWIGISHGGGGKYGVHGNSNSRSIGTYASLGCVRMFNQDVEQLYEKVKTNTPIWIGSEELLESYGVKFKSNYTGKPAKEKPVIPPKKVNLTLDGEEIKLSKSVINKDGTTYYPFREILELVNAEVIWNPVNNKVKGILQGKYVEFQLNNGEYLANGNYSFLPQGQRVFAKDDWTYVPIRNLMEALGYEVGWDQSTNTVVINWIVPEEEVEEEDEIQEDYESEEDNSIEEDVNIEEVEDLQDVKDLEDNI